MGDESKTPDHSRRRSQSGQKNGQNSLSADHVRTILDTAMDGIISLNAQQQIILFNAAAESIFGWKANQVLGRSIDLLIPGRFAVQHRQSVEQFGQGIIQSRRLGVQRTVMALHHDGHEFPIEASISQTNINREQIYTVILRDVTESVRRREQIERQSQMLDQVSDAVSVVDTSGLVTFWNHDAQKLFGWPPEEAVGKYASDLHFKGQTEVLQSIMRQTDEQGSWSGELTNTTRNGKMVNVDHRQTILRDADRIKSYLCIDINITERKEQARISLRSQRLESIGTLAGGIAHDLNNVLTPILMGAKLLSSDRVPANREGLLDTLVASAQRGASLIQQLLSFAGGLQGERQSIHISQLILEIRRLLEHTFPKSIRIDTRTTDDCPAVLGDATELSQILMNLCINARDAMPDGGVLTIESERVRFHQQAALPHPEAQVGTYLRVNVCDTGCGMTADVLDRIFDPFFTTKDIGKGTGLGLAIVQGIVKSHGGFILVYSEPGCGSSFSIFLPAAAKGSVGSDNDPDDLGPLKAGGERTILLVDDEALILQITTAVLEANGYRIITAGDGNSAIIQYSQNPGKISAVLLDMMMPGIDGLETLKKLLEIHPGAKVIACSGLGTAQREQNAIRAGALAFLSKPYSEHQLLDALSAVLQET